MLPVTPEDVTAGQVAPSVVLKTWPVDDASHAVKPLTTLTVVTGAPAATVCVVQVEP